MEEHTDLIGLKKKDAIDRAKWHDSVYKLSLQTFKRHEVNSTTCINADKTRFMEIDLSLPYQLA